MVRPQRRVEAAHAGRASTVVTAAEAAAVGAADRLLGPREESTSSFHQLRVTDGGARMVEKV
jgi:hypothetical protein